MQYSHTRTAVTTYVIDNVVATLRVRLAVELFPYVAVACRPRPLVVFPVFDRQMQRHNRVATRTVSQCPGRGIRALSICHAINPSESLARRLSIYSRGRSGFRHRQMPEGVAALRRNTSYRKVVRAGPCERVPMEHHWEMALTHLQGIVALEWWTHRNRLAVLRRALPCIRYSNTILSCRCGINRDIRAGLFHRSPILSPRV